MYTNRTCISESIEATASEYLKKISDPENSEEKVSKYLKQISERLDKDDDVFYDVKERAKEGKANLIWNHSSELDLTLW